MVNPLMNKYLSPQAISANPLGEQKLPVGQQPKIPVPNVPKLNTPQKDTLVLNKKNEKPEINKTAEKDDPPAEPVGAQVKNPMNVGLVKPGIPSSYAEGRTPEPNLDPKMLAQAGIDPNDPQQLAALGLSPEQMKQVATNVQNMAKTGQAGATAIWKAVGVGVVALSGLFLVATKKGKTLVDQGMKWIKDKGIIGDIAKNAENVSKSLQAKSSSFFTDLTKPNTPVTAIVDDAAKTFKNNNLQGYLNDLIKISRKERLSVEAFRDIDIVFWKDLSAGAPNKSEEVKTVLMNVFEVAKKFSAVDGIVPKIKINLGGLGNLDKCFSQMRNEAKDLDNLIDLISKNAIELKSGKPIGELVESISLTALEAGEKARNPIVYNVGNSLFKNDRTAWKNILGFLGF